MWWLSIALGKGNARAGRNMIVKTARAMGLRSPLADTPSLPIGAAEVTVLDHTVAMATFLFSLAGIPPLAGFIGKFYIFAAVIHGQFYALALVGLANSVVSLYYYARIVRTMFLDFPVGGEGSVALDWSNGVLLGVLAICTVVLGVYWAPVIAVADRSVRFFMG